MSHRAIFKCLVKSFIFGLIMGVNWEIFHPTPDGGWVKWKMTDTILFPHMMSTIKSWAHHALRLVTQPSEQHSQKYKIGNGEELQWACVAKENQNIAKRRADLESAQQNAPYLTLGARLWDKKFKTSHPNRKQHLWKKTPMSEMMFTAPAHGLPPMLPLPKCPFRAFFCFGVNSHFVGLIS